MVFIKTNICPCEWINTAMLPLLYFKHMPSIYTGHLCIAQGLCVAKNRDHDDHYADIFISKLGRNYNVKICITLDSDVIMCNSDVIMFLPRVFVCLSICHDVCPDNLTMKDWCHKNNIQQAHSWRGLVVQVMFHAPVTSLVTSADHTEGQILKLLYIHQYFSKSVNQNFKISEMLMTILLVYSTSGITSGKQDCCDLKIVDKQNTPNYAKKYFSWSCCHRWRYREASNSALGIIL